MSSQTATTDRDALVAAILDAPADDAQRLVYADFLQENGRDETAALIRLQVAAHRATGRERGRARDRLDRFLKGLKRSGQARLFVPPGFSLRSDSAHFHAAEFRLWMVPDEPTSSTIGLPGWYLYVRGGLVDRVDCPVEEFVVRAGDVFRMHPAVTAVILHGVWPFRHVRDDDGVTYWAFARADDSGEPTYGYGGLPISLFSRLPPSDFIFFDGDPEMDEIDQEYTRCYTSNAVAAAALAHAALRLGRHLAGLPAPSQRTP